MDISLIKSIPLSTSSFAKLRNLGQIYVDKTDMIYKLASLNQQFFLVRPRCFGRSLLVSTLSSLFQHGLRDFKGLAIEKLWKDPSKYLVVTINFSFAKFFKNRLELAKKLRDIVLGAFSQVGFIYSHESPLGLYGQLTRWIGTLPPASLVLLVDEYDAPMSSCIATHKLCQDAQRELLNVFGWIKSNNEAFRFVFVTGLTKFANFINAPELNNFRDISLMPEYGTLLGYTHEDLWKYFKLYIEQAASTHKMSAIRLMEKLEQQYGGFCFDKNASTHVFSPTSILNFFTYPANGFENFWLGTAGKLTILSKYLAKHELTDPDSYRQGCYIAKSLLFNGSSCPSLLDERTLLTQLGYLTVKSSLCETFEVGFPNKEVFDSFYELRKTKQLFNNPAYSLSAGSAS